MIAQLNKKFRNNQYLVLKEIIDEKTTRPIAIDMRNRKKMELSAAIAGKKDTEIISWMKKQK